jgi:hypothetical protein
VAAGRRAGGAKPPEAATAELPVFDAGMADARDPKYTVIP